MSNIIDQALTIVQNNNLSSTITLIKGKMEEITLPVEKVDIIISEWMGYFLLYESMLDTVIVASDKYLCEGGLIFPDKATIYLAAIEDGDYKEEKIGFWNSVYGFDYSSIKPMVLREPLVDVVNIAAVVSSPSVIKELDLYTVQKSDLTFRAPFTVTAARDDFIHAFVAWFDIAFTACHKPIRFSTGPHAQPTHWKQTVFYTPGTLTIKAGERVEGWIECKPNEKNPRDLDIVFDWAFSGALGSNSTRMEYKMY